MNTFLSKAKRYGVAMLVGLSISAPAWSSPLLSMTSTPGAVNPGGSMTLNINASDFTDLYAYQLSIHFDPTLFRAVSVHEGTFLSNAGATFFDGGSIDNTTGVISFVFDTLLSAVPGANGGGLLDSISFTAVRRGIGTFSLGDVLLLNSSLASITASTPTLAVAVPEPEMGALLLAAAAAFGTVSFFRRKQKAR